MSDDAPITPEEAWQQAEQRWSETLESHRRCHCARPLRMRKYLGRWLCGICGYLRETGKC